MSEAARIYETVPKRVAGTMVLVGQPNCGKSTVFNAVAGYRALAANCPGTTACINSTQIRVKGESIELVDLPGIYSLFVDEPVEKLALNWLLEHKDAVVINIIDASLLGRSLELTLELLELGNPMVICLNMLDEARRKGIEIDLPKLAALTGLPVKGTVASKGEGIDRLFEEAGRSFLSGARPAPIPFSDDVEQVIRGLESELGRVPETAGLPSRFFAVKLLEEDQEVSELVSRLAPEKQEAVAGFRRKLAQTHGRESAEVIFSERHALALNLFEKSSRVRQRTPPGLGEKIDSWLMHKYLGYVFVVLIFFGLFVFVFWTGKFLETPLLALFGSLQQLLAGRLGQNLAGAMVRGLIEGFAGGVGIVIPYLVPFLLGLSLLEDVGYLPRAAFLMDNFMHRIGLHGKSVVPFVLGYGCNVPALMSVRTLENRRDRIITAVLTTMIPCSARTTVIFGLAAYLLGPAWALAIYIFNLLLIAGVGKALTFFMPDPTEGMIMEVPSYKMPSLRIMFKKLWFRLREFIVVAWPILIIGSVVLSLLQFLELEQYVNRVLSPLVVFALGLPEKVGVTLIFGVLRKELTLVMLGQALGTTDFLSIMSRGQVVVFTVFVVLYLPCLATLSVLQRILGWKGMLGTAALTLALAVLGGLLFRLVLAAVGYS